MRDYPGFTLRLAPDLRETLQKAAKTTGRSLNAEIAARLSESLNPTKRSKENEPEEFSVDQQAIIKLLKDIQIRITRIEESTDTRLRIEKLEAAIAEIQHSLENR